MWKPLNLISGDEKAGRRDYDDGHGERARGRRRQQPRAAMAAAADSSNEQQSSYGKQQYSGGDNREEATNKGTAGTCVHESGDPATVNNGVNDTD